MIFINSYRFLCPIIVSLWLATIRRSNFSSALQFESFFTSGNSWKFHTRIFYLFEGWTFFWSFLILITLMTLCNDKMILQHSISSSASISPSYILNHIWIIRNVPASVHTFIDSKRDRFPLELNREKFPIYDINIEY